VTLIVNGRGTFDIPLEGSIYMNGKITFTWGTEKIGADFKK
jgi:hypothetical protein